MNPPVKWAAELADVEEASILGVADWGYWNDHLRQADLVPAERDGKAQILIVAGAARFAGIGFRELSFSVLVSQPGQWTWRESSYLIQAINSSRPFAFCERAFLSTPYLHGNLRLASALPDVVEWAEKGRVLFRAQMQAEASATSREPSTCGEDGWEGAVFLPDQHGHDDNRRKMFFARLQGYAKRYPFLGERDMLKVEPSPDVPVLQALVDSRFAPAEWVLRPKAIHAKSKTYRRGDFLESSR
jgi:hypothetical protein